MDPTRQIRLLIAPFFFYVSLITAIVFSTNLEIISLVKSYTTESHGIANMAGLAGFIAVSALPVGFLISSLTTLVLRYIFCEPFKAHDISVGEKDIEDILDQSKSLLSINELKRISKLEYFQKTPKPIIGSSEKLCTICFFDHGLLYNIFPGIHYLLTRCYSAFIISLNCLVALTISLILVSLYDMYPPHLWCWLNYGCVVVLIGSALHARYDFAKIYRFMLKLDIVKNEQKECVCKQKDEDKNGIRNTE